jgi:hypothetical protein
MNDEGQHGADGLNRTQPVSLAAASAEPHGVRFGFHPSSFILLLLGLGVASAEDYRTLAVPVDGEPFPAQLAAVDERWQMTFATPVARRVLPAASLVSWGRCVDAARGPLVVLADGSLLAAEVHGADREGFSADSSLFGALRLPRMLVAGVLLHPPADRARRDSLIDRVLSSVTGATDGRGLTGGDADRALLVNGDEVAGTIERIAEGKIRLQSTVGPLELEIRRVGAILCRAALVPRGEVARAPEALGATAGFRDGTRLYAASLVIVENSLRVTLPGGIAWNTSPKELAFLQPRGGQVVYLSDVKPESYRHVPFLGLSWPYHVDRNVAGGMLRGGGMLCLKGLGMHSASRLSYALAEPYRRFQAELVVDDQTNGGGSVGFRVFVDGQVRHASPIVRGGQPPVPVSVDIAGAKRIDLVVDFADRADELDHADWLNARLLR